MPMSALAGRRKDCAQGVWPARGNARGHSRRCSAPAPHGIVPCASRLASGGSRALSSVTKHIRSDSLDLQDTFGSCDGFVRLDLGTQVGHTAACELRARFLFCWRNGATQHRQDVQHEGVRSCVLLVLILPRFLLLLRHVPHGHVPSGAISHCLPTPNDPRLTRQK